MSNYNTKNYTEQGGEKTVIGGELVIEVANPAISLVKGQPGSVFDADGSAIVIHAGADDYKSDPAGNAGGRIVCGVTPNWRASASIAWKPSARTRSTMARARSSACIPGS